MRRSLVGIGWGFAEHRARWGLPDRERPVVRRDSLDGQVLMIIRRTGLRSGQQGARQWLYYSDTGGLTHYGAYVETLQLGALPADKHWHEREDEFLYVIAGEVTVIEDQAEFMLRPGDAACWPAGQPVAHTVANRSSGPCTYLIVGTRITHDVCHYPDTGRVLYTEGEQWRIEGADGGVLTSGRCKSPPGRD